MACTRCDLKGFVESWVIRDGKQKSILLQCQFCRDTPAYSDEVQRRQSEKPKTQSKPMGPGVVLPIIFRKRSADAGSKQP